MKPELFNNRPLEEKFLLVREYGEPLCPAPCSVHEHIFYYMLDSLVIEATIALKGFEPVSVKALGVNDPEMDGFLFWVDLDEIDEFCRPGHNHPF
jgi:hypothetical protein